MIFGLFLTVGAFSATGIPLMALAMGNIASLMLNFGDPKAAQKLIHAKVTPTELEMMKKFELDDGDGVITRAEYILLCTVRLGALNPDLVGIINKRFNELDKSGDGNLDYAEILEDETKLRILSSDGLTASVKRRLSNSMQLETAAFSSNDRMNPNPMTADTTDDIAASASASQVNANSPLIDSNNRV